MDPIIEAQWSRIAKDVPKEEEEKLNKLRALLNAELQTAMGPEFAKKIWDLADEAEEQGRRADFQEGFRLAGRLVLSMLA